MRPQHAPSALWPSHGLHGCRSAVGGCLWSACRASINPEFCRSGRVNRHKTAQVGRGLPPRMNARHRRAGSACPCRWYNRAPLGNYRLGTLSVNPQAGEGYQKAVFEFFAFAADPWNQVQVRNHPPHVVGPEGSHWCTATHRVHADGTAVSRMVSRSLFQVQVKHSHLHSLLALRCLRPSRVPERTGERVTLSPVVG